MRYDDPDAIRLFHYCGELGLPVIFHLDTTFPRHGVASSRQWWYGGGIENIEEPLKLCTKTQFLGHAPAFWREISGDADQEPSAISQGQTDRRPWPAARFSRPLSQPELRPLGGLRSTALSRDLEFTRKFLIDYQDRCFFGRDQFDKPIGRLARVAQPA